MDFYERLLLHKSLNKLGYKDIGDVLGMPHATMRMAINRRSLSDLQKRELTNHFQLENKVEQSRTKESTHDKFKNITTEDVIQYVLSHIDELRLNGLFRSIIEKEKSKNIDGEEVVKKIMERLQPFYEIAMHHSIKLDEVKESIKNIKKWQ